MKKIFILIALVGILGSCTDLSDKLYDRLPADKYPENPQQAALMLIPVLQPLQDYCDWGGYWFAQELTGDGIVCPTRGTDWDDGGKWRVLHQHTWTNDVEAVNSMWYRFYKGIYEANKFIEFLKPASDAGQEAAKVSIAQAKALRAFYYWNAIDTYGDVPYVTVYATADKNPYRNHKNQIWQKIINELENDVVPYVDQFTNSKYSVSKGMVYTLLVKLYINSNVYLGLNNNSDEYKANLQKALNYANKVIDECGYILEADVKAPFVTQNENSTENIFCIGYDQDNYKGFNLHMRTLHYDSQKTFDMVVQPWNGFAATEAFYNSFEDNDKRKEFFLVGPQFTYSGAPLQESTLHERLNFSVNIPALHMTAGTYTPQQIRMSGVRVVKFEIKKGASADLSNDFPIFRLADVILMRAEIKVRLNGVGAGDSDLNQIRQRAGLSAKNGATLDDILSERKKELFWEAHIRTDLIRYGKFLDAWWEKDQSTADRLNFPVPKWAIDANPNLAAEIKDIQ